MKATLIDVEIKIDNNDYFTTQGVKIPPIVDRPFTQAELDAYAIGAIKVNTAGTDIVIDQAKIDQLNANKIAENKKRLLDDLKSKIDQEINVILSVYPERVIASFPAKEIEARQLILDNTNNSLVASNFKTIYAEAQIVNNTATPTDQNCIDIANRIITNADLFKGIAGKAQGEMTKYTAIINDPLTDLLTYQLPVSILNL